VRGGRRRVPRGDPRSGAAGPLARRGLCLPRADRSRAGVESPRRGGAHGLFPGRAGADAEREPVTPAASTTLRISAGRREGAPGVPPDTAILGLPLLRRAVLAGERAGFTRIVVEGTPGFDPSRLLAGTR